MYSGATGELTGCETTFDDGKANKLVQISEPSGSATTGGRSSLSVVQISYKISRQICAIRDIMLAGNRLTGFPPAAGLAEEFRAAASRIVLEMRLTVGRTCLSIRYPPERFSSRRIKSSLFDLELPR